MDVYFNEVRMIERISKKLTRFYQVSLILIMFCTLGTILYFWKLGIVDGSRSKDLHEASFILETYESKNILKEIKSLISNENPKIAIQKTKNIEEDFEKINNQVEVAEYDSLNKDIQNLKVSAAKIISYSKMSKVINVFNLKMNKFYGYVKDNKWRILTRMSDRVFSQTNGHINKNKLHRLVKNVNRDFESMVKITEKSILSRKDKSEIVSRVSNLQVEMKMLKKYANERQSFYQLHKKLNVSMNKWFKAVAPEITLQKLKIERIGRLYVMGLLGILLLTTTCFFVSFLFNKYFFRKAQGEIEDEIEKFVSNVILASKDLNSDEYSEVFRSYGRKMSTYFNKRMSFGTIFQDALPLSSILLDKNLKVLWANKHFCNDWEISEEEVNKDYMSWDFLNKLTNIGNDDPVLEALKHDVAGIYQVQVKPNDDSAARPFEMFVSPVKFQGESRIMIFFYDLTNLEQTIQDQARSLISPIDKSLSLMNAGKFTPDKELAKEFNIAGINDTYGQFVSLNEKMENTENNLLDEIEILHNEIYRYEEQKTVIFDNIAHSLQNNKLNVAALKTFKENVIELITMSRSLDRLTVKGHELVNANINAIKTSMAKVNSIKSITEEIVDTLPGFNSLKDQIRESKSSLFESKSKLSHELNQLSKVMKKSSDYAQLERYLSKVGETFEHLSSSSEELDKRVCSLELLMSKAQIVLSSSTSKLEKVSTDFENQQLQISEAEIKTMKKNFMNSVENFDTYEQEIVQSLQQIFKSTKSNIGLNAEAKQELDSHQILHTLRQAPNEQPQASV